MAFPTLAEPIYLVARTKKAARHAALEPASSGGPVPTEAEARSEDRNPG
jgi:hypothetical protein